MNISVWFSAGVTSAVAAKKALATFGRTADISILYNPVKEEDPDNLRFLSDCEDWFGVPVERCINPSWPNCSAVEVFDKRKFMSGPHGAPCTLELKKKARMKWEDSHRSDFHVLGFSAEEQVRASRFMSTERNNVIFPLISAGMTKDSCFREIAKAGIQPPISYERGFSHSNCVGCVKSSSPKYWNLVRRFYPDVFAQRVEQSDRLGSLLLVSRGKRVRLGSLRFKDDSGSIGTVDCGLFCEEKL